MWANILTLSLTCWVAGGQVVYPILRQIAQTIKQGGRIFVGWDYVVIILPPQMWSHRIITNLSKMSCETWLENPRAYFFLEWHCLLFNWLVVKIQSVRKSICSTRYPLYTSWCQVNLKPLCFPVQWSMTALVSHGCRVMEGDFTFDWNGSGMLLEQSVMWLRVWWCLSNPWQ